MLILQNMADNYLEKKYEEYLERKAAAEKARRLAWKKRMDAYRKKLADENNAAAEADVKTNDNDSNGNLA